MKLGILGAGQLARLMIQEGKKISEDLFWEVASPFEENCTSDLVPTQVFDFNQIREIERFFLNCDRVTYDWENLPLEVIQQIPRFQDKLFPTIKVLEIVADRANQKEFFKSIGVPVTPFVRVSKVSDVEKAVKELGFPGVFKTSRWGYDGKGQKIIRNPSELSKVWQELGSQELVYERWMNFEREVSLIAVRSKKGDWGFYPLTQNFHRNGILRWSLALARQLNPSLQVTAENYAKKIGNAFEYEGVFVLEFFQVGDDLVVNEMASRVHNSGHWTVEGSEISQFENHVRVGLRLPPQSGSLIGIPVMLNFIGAVPSEKIIQRLKRDFSNLYFHLYGKTPKVGRKLGHVTIVEESPLRLKEILTVLENVLGLDTPKEAIQSYSYS